MERKEILNRIKQWYIEAVRAGDTLEINLVSKGKNHTHRFDATFIAK